VDRRRDLEARGVAAQPPRRAHIAEGEIRLEAEDVGERKAHHRDRFAGLHRGIAAKARYRGEGALRLEQGEVVRGVGGGDRRHGALAPGIQHGDRLAALRHVVIGEDQAIGRDDDAGADHERPRTRRRRARVLAPRERAGVLQQTRLQPVRADVRERLAPALRRARALDQPLAALVVERDRGERRLACLALARLGADRALEAVLAVAAVAGLAVLDAHAVMDVAIFLAHRRAVEEHLGGRAGGEGLPGFRGGGRCGEKQGEAGKDRRECAHEVQRRAACAPLWIMPQRNRVVRAAGAKAVARFSFVIARRQRKGPQRDALRALSRSALRSSSRYAGRGCASPRYMLITV
jgi:hypothetical protein